MSTAVAYHYATKYHPETIGQSGGIDWSRQPVPYKEYDCADPVELAGFLPFDPNPFTGRPAGAAASADPDGGATLATLARLMFFTYGITGVVQGQPRPLFLRASPSAGGLYPSELYVVARAWPGLAPGLYGYEPRRHQLVPLWADEAAADALTAACYDHAAVAAAPLLLVATGVFNRSSWRYGERAYRRVLLDTGHLLANATLAAPALGLRATLTAAFCDDGLNTLLRVDPTEEGALAVLALNLPGATERPAWSALPSPPGPTQAEPPLLSALHLASRLPAARPALVARGEDQADGLEQRYPRGGVPLPPPLAGPLAGDPLTAILRRRSTRRYRRAAMTLPQLAGILDAACCPERVGLGEQGSLDRSLLMTFVAALAVDGLAQGLYYFAPHSRELRLIKGECSREAVQFLCLGQELGGDAAAVVFHTADLALAVRRQGDRAYRYLHLDAGMVGERLDLAALAAGLGASGIGGFFDDRVTDLLGLPSEQAVIYITTLGTPVAQRDPDDEEKE
jgi:SagB-type dehydrogenase family enzyme